MKPHLGIAWLLITLSLAIHVIDEALNDFLSFWNPIAKISGFLPVFTFTQWLTGLILVIIILFALSLFAFRQKKWICYFSIFYGAVMILNAFGHFIGSFYFNEPVAGVYSSPLLFLSSVYLLWSSIRTLKTNTTSKKMSLE